MYGCGESVAQQVIYSVFGFFSRWRCCLGLLAWGRLLWLMSLQSMLGTTWWKSMPGEKLQRMMTISPNASFLLWTLVLLPVLWQWRSQRGRVPETHRRGNSNEVGFRIQREAELPHHWRNRRSSFGTFKSQKLNESSFKITTTTTFYEINIHFSKFFILPSPLLTGCYQHPVSNAEQERRTRRWSRSRDGKKEKEERVHPAPTNHLHL